LGLGTHGRKAETPHRFPRPFFIVRRKEMGMKKRGKVKMKGDAYKGSSKGEVGKK
jgi:hypothetical protein